eukprot:m.126555 g.126555  ORF g.126555 m.126555 type:complete len:191 (+) comp37905_c0_seq1:344-916(+)
MASPPAIAAFREACCAAGCNEPSDKAIDALVSPRQPRRGRGPTSARPEPHKVRRARVYGQLKRHFWYGCHYGENLVAGGPFSASDPTYVWPEVIKTFLRTLFPDDVQAAADPGNRRPETQERPICCVSLQHYLMAFKQTPDGRPLLLTEKLQPPAPGVPAPFTPPAARRPPPSGDDDGPPPSQIPRLAED